MSIYVVMHPIRIVTRTNRHLRTMAVALVGLASAVLAPAAANAAIHPIYRGTIVGTGTPASCTEAAVRAAVAGGGVVTFHCGAHAVRITISRAIAIVVGTYIDGQGCITLAGTPHTRVFRVNPSARLTLKNLTVVDG